MKEILKLVFSGTMIGVANIIPGVSGGTMAVILGIYDRLMEAIGEFFTNKAKRKEYFLFLIQIAIGAIAGILLLAKLLKLSLEHYPEPTVFLFMGLIIGSLPVLTQEIKGKKIKAFPVVTFLLGVGLVLSTTLFLKHSASIGYAGVLSFGTGDYIKLLMSGLIASGAMVIPGISGSFMLILLGEYSRILKMVSEFSSQKSYLLPLGAFAVGVALGIILFARLMDFCLKKNRTATMSFVIGLVIASLVVIWPGFSTTGLLAFLNIAVLIFGLVLAFLLGKIKNK